jgi:hypothetical protein
MERDVETFKGAAVDDIAKVIVRYCFRDTSLEGIHGGHWPITKAGDYSDVKVVDGEGREIPWSKLGRISQGEMKTLMKEAVDRVYSILVLLMEVPDARQFVNKATLPVGWDDPGFVKGLAEYLLRFGGLGVK